MHVKSEKVGCVYSRLDILTAYAEVSPKITKKHIYLITIIS